MSNKLINILFYIGRLFSPIYGLAMIIRARLYKTGVKASVKLAVPVISVGNLTMGGTGKTPLVIHLARLLGASGKNPAIISRGYGGKSKKAVNIVSTGANILMSAAEAGDEPVLLAKTLGIPVLTGPRRILTGRYVVNNKMADSIIMDDGYQHLALRRNLNIALFAGGELLGNGRVFPGGPLREPYTALQRADCFVITGVTADNRNELNKFRRNLRESYPATPVFQGTYRPRALTANTDEIYDLESMMDLPVLAFCGIAKPRSFFDLLQGRFNIKQQRAFADHHPYTEHDLSELVREAEAKGCQALLTTEKDLVKLKKFNPALPLRALQIELAMSREFDDFVLQTISP